VSLVRRAPVHILPPPRPRHGSSVRVNLEAETSSVGDRRGGEAGRGTRCMRAEVLTAVKVHVVAVWAVTPCSLVRGYHHFGGVHYLFFFIWTMRL
jgi:hypothetical protein